MDLFSKIVVPLDGSDASARALPVAVALSKTTTAPIVLVTVAVHDDHVAEAERVLRRAAEHLDQPSDRKVLVGLPAAKQLLDYLHPDRGAVVVMSTHARTAVGDLLLGSVADEVVRRSPVPVVLVGPHAPLPAKGSTYRDVVACVDGRHEAERLLPLVSLLGSKYSMHPWLFEVLIPDGLPATAEGDILETNYVHHLADELLLGGVEADWDVGHNADRADAIVEFAAFRDAPIIVLATHGRAALDRLRAASVTVTVARSASCPVLVVGPAFADVAAATQ